MTTEPSLERPYPPNFIHRCYGWLDRLPVPGWLLLLLLIPTIGLAQYVVAWTREFLAPGEFSRDLGYSGSYLVGILLALLYGLDGAPRAVDQFRPLLTVTEEQYARLRYEFVTTPSGPGILFFVIGGILGAFNGSRIWQSLPLWIMHFRR